MGHGLEMRVQLLDSRRMPRAALGTLSPRAGPPLPRARFMDDSTKCSSIDCGQDVIGSTRRRSSTQRMCGFSLVTLLTRLPANPRQGWLSVALCRMEQRGTSQTTTRRDGRRCGRFQETQEIQVLEPSLVLVP